MFSTTVMACTVLLCRLLDTITTYNGGNLRLTLVCEYIDKDLVAYIANVPKPQGLGLSKVKVQTRPLFSTSCVHVNAIPYPVHFLL